jgi:hypothetical protein
MAIRIIIYKIWKIVSAFILYFLFGESISLTVTATTQYWWCTFHYLPPFPNYSTTNFSIPNYSSTNVSILFQSFHKIINYFLKRLSVTNNTLVFVIKRNVSFTLCPCSKLSCLHFIYKRIFRGLELL